MLGSKNIQSIRRSFVFFFCWFRLQHLTVQGNMDEGFHGQEVQNDSSYWHILSRYIWILYVYTPLYIYLLIHRCLTCIYFNISSYVFHCA